MQYRPFGKLGISVSTLGFGCMRLPLKQATEGAYGNVTEEREIDEAKTIELIHYAIDHGVNYIDTAYNYHAEQSQYVVGKALKDGYRAKTLLATKLPCWLVNTHEDFDRLLNGQLRRLDTDHIDFYLLHALNGPWWRKLKDLGVLEFLDRAVADGRIRYPSFSFHDNFPTFKEIIDSYDWSMCQIQLNYMNEDYQAGMAGLRYAAAKGIPVVIMEPLLGGKLAQTPPQDVAQVWASAQVKRSPAEWAFRWVCDLPEVAVVLSGMNSLEQLIENLRIFDQALPNNLNADDHFLIDQVKSIYRARTQVNCTQCRYCMPCPQKVAIPQIFGMYNQKSIYGTVQGAFVTYESMRQTGSDASHCAECGQCEQACPQGIPIINKLKDAHQALSE